MSSSLHPAFGDQKHKMNHTSINYEKARLSSPQKNAYDIPEHQPPLLPSLQAIHTLSLLSSH